MSGLIDWLFGNTDEAQKQKQSGSSTTNTTDTKAQQEVTGKSTTGTTEGASNTAGTQTQTGTALSQGNISVLNSLISGAAAKPTVYGTNTLDALGLQKQLSQKAVDNATTGIDTDAIIKSQQDAAKLSYNEGEGAQLNQFGDDTGSKLNSTVQLLQQKGQRDLATTLAAIAGDTKLKAADLQNQAINVGGAVTNQNTASSAGVDQGGSLALQDALNALNVSKGTETTQATSALTSGTTSQTSTQNEVTQDLLQQMIEELSNTKSSGSSSGSGNTAQSGSLLPLLDILSRF